MTVFRLAQPRPFRPRPALRAALLAGLAAAGLAGCGRGAPPAAPHAAPPQRVTTALVARERLPLQVSGVGTVQPMASVTVRSRVDGQLESVAFREGQDVQAGQVLARIDPRSFQAQLAQAQAQQARDQAQLANAQADLQRYEALIRDDATTPQTLQAQKALVSQLRAALQGDAAQIQVAQVQLGYTTLTAPIGGRVGARLVDAGNIVHAADAGGLVVINQVDPIAVQFTVPEKAFQDVNRALHASPVPLTVEAIDRDTRQVLARGELALVNNQIDTATGTLLLKAHFPNPAHRLWPGQSIEARLTLGVQPDALSLPEAALQRGPNGYEVFVVDAGDTVRVQPVAVDRLQDGKAVFARGLAAGQRVVVDGQYRLIPGAHVREGAPARAASGARP